jgi:hypothetical protein
MDGLFHFPDLLLFYGPEYITLTTQVQVNQILEPAIKDLKPSSSGKNLMFGYSDGPWHQKWLFTYFPEDDNIKANVEITYKF